MMKALIVLGLLAAVAFAVVPAAEARPLPCEPKSGDGYVAVVCSDLHACVVVNYDLQQRYCSP